MSCIPRRTEAPLSAVLLNRKGTANLPDRAWTSTALWRKTSNNGMVADAGPPDKGGTGDQEWAECPAGDWVIGEPYAVPTVGDDTSESEKSCSTAPGASWWGLLVGGLVALRRHR